MNFIIIGCGKIGQRHAEHISKRGVLAAVCDIIPAKAESLAKTYGARPYYSLDDLLQNEKNIDVAAVCTPNGLHAEHTIACLDAGIHVLCEKPMALKQEDCERMIAAAEKNNRLLAIVKQNRFNPPVVVVKDLLNSGRLGKIMSFQLNCFWNRDAGYYLQSNWKGTKELDGGILFTQFSHFIDLLYWLLGEVKDVQAFAGNFHHRDVLAGEDTGVVILQMESGAVGTLNYTINSCKKNMEGSLTLFGDKGTVKIGGEYLNTLEYQCLDSGEIIQIPKGGGANDYGSYKGSMSNHDKVYDNILDVFKNGAPLSTNAVEGMKTVEIIERIMRQFENSIIRQ